MPKETALRLNLVNEVLLPNEYSDVSNGHIKVLVIPMQTRFLFLPDFVLTLTDGEAISRLMAHSTHGAKKEKRGLIGAIIIPLFLLNAAAAAAAALASPSSFVRSNNRPPNIGVDFAANAELRRRREAT
jgi:hypothetical protein